MGHVSSKTIQSEAEHVYDSLDTHKRGYITMMDLVLHNQGQSRQKAKPVHNTLQYIYSHSMIKEQRLPKQQFLALYTAKFAEEQKQLLPCRKPHKSMSKRFTDRSNKRSKSCLDTFLANYNENGTISADVLQHIQSVALDTTNKEAEMLSQFGINSRSSLHILYRPEFFTETVTKQFVTEEDVSKIVEYLALMGIDVGRTLDSSFKDMFSCDTDHTTSIDLNSSPQQHAKRNRTNSVQSNSNDGRLAALVMREYDYTNTGYLNEHEFSHFIQRIQGEIEAHNFFLGADMKEIGPYVTGRTLGFGSGGLVKTAIHKDILMLKKTRQVSSVKRPLSGSPKIACDIPETRESNQLPAIDSQIYKSCQDASPSEIGISYIMGSKWKKKKPNNQCSDPSVSSTIKTDLDSHSLSIANFEKTPSDFTSANANVSTKALVSKRTTVNSVPFTPQNLDSLEDATISAQVALKIIPTTPRSTLVPNLGSYSARRRNMPKKQKSRISDAGPDTTSGCSENMTDGTACPSDKTKEAVHCTEPVALKFLSGHQNIVELIDTFQYIDNTGNDWTAMVLTLCGGGSLKEYRANTVVTEPMARYFFSQIMSAVLYMHLHGIAHMDLRLENCLLDNNCSVRVCDFGTAMSFSLDENSKTIFDTVRRGTVAGTLANMPPEMLLLQSSYSATKVDMWCCGLILYELLTAKPAFGASDKRRGSNSDGELSKKICANICNMIYEALGFNYSEGVRDLCSKLLAYDPADRPDAYEVLCHPWMRQEMIRPALAKGILMLDPAPPTTQVQHYLEQLLTLEGVEIRRSKDKKQNNLLIKLMCTHNASLIAFIVTGEIIHSSDRLNNDDIELGYIYNIMQSASGGTVAENDYIRRIQNHESVFKLTFYLKTGLMWEFQRLFRRIRYCLINAFSSTEDIINDGLKSRNSIIIDNTPACIRVEAPAFQ